MKILSFSSKTGTTLIELMIALIIIALIILGGGMFFFYGRVNIIREAHRRAALLVASQRLEELKAAEWGDIALDPTTEIPDPLDQPYYIKHGSPWDRSLEEVRDTEVPVDNLSDGEMVTEAQWVDDDPDDGIDSYDYLEVTVTVEWSDSTTNSVSLSTLIAPR